MAAVFIILLVTCFLLFVFFQNRPDNSKPTNTEADMIVRKILRNEGDRNILENWAQKISTEYKGF